jgi:hypothetical protein
MTSKLSVQGVTSGYVKGIDILNDVSLDIEGDAITGIVEDHFWIPLPQPWKDRIQWAGNPGAFSL